MAATLLADFEKRLHLDAKYLLVAAIDFGTTFSAYAFSFKSSKNDIRMNKNWGAELGCDSFKAPTCVMTNPDGSFHSFGYEAEEQYHQLNPDTDIVGGPKGYNLYRHFKMLLHNQGVSLKTNVVSTSGHRRTAIEIFAMVLKYLHGHMVQSMRKALTNCPDHSEIRWVLTVPAIWTDESKGFMREAAFRAGLISEKSSNQLLIALEPEAASIFCRSLEISNFSSSIQDTESLQFIAGEQILVVDAGGGTVDITAHEVLIDGKVKEISPPSGGPWGGIKVDEKFVDLMADIFGDEFVSAFQAQNPQEWLQFKTSFEKSKKSLKPDGKSYLKVGIHYSFGEEFRASKQISVAEAIKQKGNAAISFCNGSLLIAHDRAKQLFEEPIRSIVSHVQELLTKHRKLKYILLVGGFGECNILQAACTDTFAKSLKVLIPLEAQLAIIKGAVLFGHNPMEISSRIARFTYGIECEIKFIDGLHDPTKRYINEDNIPQCCDIFETFCRKGEEIKTGEVRNRLYHPIKKNQREVWFTVYKADKYTVKYTDESGVVRLGEAVLRSQSGPLSPNLKVKITFGHTEILFEARDERGERSYPMKMTIDFLTD